jgi:hypothetical protein
MHHISLDFNSVTFVVRMCRVVTCDYYDRPPPPRLEISSTILKKSPSATDSSSSGIPMFKIETATQIYE